MLSVPPNPLPVTFHNQGQWSIRRDEVVKYSVAVYEASSWDWIGLYKVSTFWLFFFKKEYQIIFCFKPKMLIFTNTEQW